MGATTWGLQFHVEVTRPVLEEWAATAAAELERIGIRPAAILGTGAAARRAARCSPRASPIASARAVLAAAIPALAARVRSSGAWRPSARRARATATTPAASLVALEGGRIKHVRGDPEHHVARGKLCRKCSIGYNGAFLDAELRLTTPLRRVGPKGEALFEPVDWADATSAIAARLHAIADEPRRRERSSTRTTPAPAR